MMEDDDGIWMMIMTMMEGDDGWWWTMKMMIDDESQKSRKINFQKLSGSLWGTTGGQGMALKTFDSSKKLKIS